MDIYKKYANELITSGRAYPCFCSNEMLEQKREAAMKLGTVPQYDGICRKITPEEAAKKKAAGENCTTRFKAPVREYKLADAVRGDVTFPPNMVGDFVILRSDGMPVYNFCCVIDDHLMGMTHIIRAEEHLSNTVRQMMLFETFGWELPVFAHCSLLLGSDRQKLSKRHGATSVHQYAEEGFLPETLNNFLSLLGWSSAEHKEIMNMDELIRLFDLDRLNKAPCVFDTTKLRWMNQQYIKSLPLSVITERAIPFLEKDDIAARKLDRAWLEKAFDVIRSGLEVLTDSGKFMQIFLNDEFVLDAEAQAIKADPAFASVAATLKAELAAHVSANGDAITDTQFTAIQDAVKTKSGAKGKGLFMPMRVTLTGHIHGPELKLIVPMIGAKRALARVERSL